jgi:hypothetical protein
MNTPMAKSNADIIDKLQNVLRETANNPQEKALLMPNIIR